MLELFHTSPAEIKEIKKDGRFGSNLFFSIDPAAMGEVKFTYKMEIAEDSIIDQSHIFFDDALDDQNVLGKVNALIEAFADKMEIEVEQAEDLVSGKITAFDLDNVEPEDAGEIDWDVQLLVANIVKEMGYRGYCFEGDFCGSSYMIDMFGHEGDLIVSVLK